MVTISVDEMVNLLAKMYVQAIEKKCSIETLPSVMLWGAPGVGKSQGVHQVAKEMEKKTGKKVHVTDVRLLLFNPIDLRGIPVANAEKTLAVWLKPQIFQMDESSEVIHILFLDEISAAPQSVQAAAYQIVLDHTIGEHHLPKNCLVIAAGNRVTDKSVAYKMPKALANRLLHLEIEGNFTSWKKWAIQNGIHEKVIGFLSFRQDALFGFDATKDDLAFPTPRTWEMVSRVLQMLPDEGKEIYPLIAGLIGKGTAVEFSAWCRIYQHLPNITKIFQGLETEVPQKSDTLFAVVSSMTVYAREHQKDLNAIRNSIRYTRKMPPEYAALLLENYLLISEEFAKTIKKMPEFMEYCEQRGILLNGHI